MRPGSRSPQREGSDINLLTPNQKTEKGASGALKPVAFKMQSAHPRHEEKHQATGICMYVCV